MALGRVIVAMIAARLLHRVEAHFLPEVITCALTAVISEAGALIGTGTRGCALRTPT